MRNAIEVTARDPLTGDEDTIKVEDNYVLVCAGSAYQASVQVHNKADGTATHVITVKGIRR